MKKFRKLRQMISVQGNGNIISKEITVSSYLQLHLCVNQEIEIYESTEEKVLIEVDENLQDFIDVSNSGRTLYVSTDTKLFKKPIFTTCKVKVFFRQLNILNISNENADFNCPEPLNFQTEIKLNIQSVGNTSLRINAPSIKLNNQCVGDVTLAGKCQFIDIKNHSVGNLNAMELISDELVIKSSGVGDVSLFANNLITINQSGVGNIFYYGPAILKDIKQNGAGIIVHK